jgi:hypothetical protein
MVDLMDLEIMLDLMDAASIEDTASAAEIVRDLVALELIAFDGGTWQPTEKGWAAIEKLDHSVH